MIGALIGRLRPESNRMAVRRHSRLGDQARDARDWLKAARHYTAALALAPASGRLWVQLGHCHKEGGAYGEAEAAYLQGYALLPGDADGALQLGHFYKLTCAADKARAYYEAARAHGSGDVNLLAFLGPPSAPGQCPVDTNRRSGRARRPVLYFDYSDLVLYFRNNRFPTGIQRVQIELFKASMQWDGAADIRSCAYSHNVHFWAEIDPVPFRRLCDMACAKGDRSAPEWLAAVRNFIHALEQQPAMALPQGATLVNVGTSWWMPNYMQAMRAAKRRHGLRYVPLVYDLVPMIVPEALDGDLRPVFSHWLGSLYLQADAIAVISRSTGRDLARAAQTVAPLCSPVIVIPLDADFRPPGRADSTGPQEYLEQLGLADESFVLFVGTLEARKDHRLVFQGWLRLLQSEGRAAVPTLVCVGKRGWRFEETEQFLASHAELANKIIMLSGISDAELRALFTACLFTVYASLYEGWGLPVSESLAYGKACLTADNSSLPEAGGAFADYFETGSVTSFVAGARRLIRDSAYRAGRETAIAAGFRCRSWHDVLAGFATALLPHIAEPCRAETFAAPVKWGVVYPLAMNLSLDKPSHVAAVGEMLRAGQSWHEMEAWGSWTKQQTATLTFCLPELTGEHYAIFSLCVRTSSSPITLTIRVEDTVCAMATLPQQARSHLIHAKLPFALLRDIRQAKALMDIDLDVDLLGNENIYGEQRAVGIGVSYVSLRQSNDVAAQLDVMEHHLMTVLAA